MLRLIIIYIALQAAYSQQKCTNPQRALNQLELAAHLSPPWAIKRSTGLCITMIQELPSKCKRDMQKQLQPTPHLTNINIPPHNTAYIACAVISSSQALHYNIIKHRYEF